MQGGLFWEGSWGHCRGHAADLFTGTALSISHTQIYIQARDGEEEKIQVDRDPQGGKRLWEKQENSKDRKQLHTGRMVLTTG